MAVRADQITVGRARPLTARVRGWLDRESVLGPVFVMPALLLLLLLVAYPFVIALYFALSDAYIGRPSHFVGFRNFIHLWESDAFRQTFQNAFVFTGTAVAFKVVLGICLALLLNEQLWFKRMIRGAVLLPWVIPTALSTLGWWWMFNSLYSVVNWTGIALGIMDPPGPNWLGQKYYAMAAVVIVASLGLDEATLGIIAAASSAVGVAAGLPAGMLSDALGRRRVILVSLLLFTATPLLYLFVTTPGQLVLVRILHGLGSATLGPAAFAAVADSYREGRGERMARRDDRRCFGDFLPTGRPYPIPRNFFQQA